MFIHQKIPDNTYYNGYQQFYKNKNIVGVVHPEYFGCYSGVFQPFGNYKSEKSIQKQAAQPYKYEFYDYVFQLHIQVFESPLVVENTRNSTTAYLPYYCCQNVRVEA